jgi:hypothetical protein
MTVSFTADFPMEILGSPPLRTTSPDWTSLTASSTESHTFLFFGNGAFTTLYARKLRLSCVVGIALRGDAQSVRGRIGRRRIVLNILVDVCTKQSVEMVQTTQSEDRGVYDEFGQG